MQLVDRAVAVVGIHPSACVQLPAQAHHHHIALFAGAGFQLVAHGLQVQRGQGVVKGHDLHQPPALRTVKECIGARARHAQVLAGQLHRLVVLDVQVVVVDAVGGKAKLAGALRGVAALHQVALLGRSGGSGLGAHQLLNAFGGGLDRAFIDVAPDPAAAAPLSRNDGSS